MLDKVPYYELDHNQFGNWQTFFLNLPRYDFHFQTVSKTFDPNSWEYWQSIIMISTPFGLAAIMAVFLIILSCCIGCCCWCRKSPKSNGYNAVDAEHAFVDTKSEPRKVYFARAGLFIFVLACAGGMVWASIANMHIHSDLTDSSQNVLAAGQVIITNLDRIDSDLAEVSNYLPDQVGPIKQTLDPYDKLSNDIYDSTSDVINDYILHYEDIRYKSFLGFFVSYGGVALIIVFLVVFTVLKPITICMILWLLMCPLFFIIAGAGTSGATILADFCPIADDFLGNITTQNGSPQDWTNYYLKCSGTPPAEPTYIQLQNASALVETQLQNAIQNNNTDLVQDLTAVLNYFIDINSSLVILNNCSVVQETWVSVRNSFCDGIFDDICAMLLGCLITAFSSVLAAFFAIHICFRYQKGTHHHEDVSQRHVQINHQPYHQTQNQQSQTQTNQNNSNSYFYNQQQQQQQSFQQFQMKGNPRHSSQTYSYDDQIYNGYRNNDTSRQPLLNKSVSQPYAMQ